MQQYTSKHTSVNTTKLPAIYKKINWWKMIHDYDEVIHVWDMGCGKETSHISEYLKQFGVQYHGYDPYWINGHNENHFDNYFNQLWRTSHLDVFICTNVLNVIASWDTMMSFKRWFVQKSNIYFISVYEGDKSGEGKVTKDDCWQWNKPLKDYITWPTEEVIRKGIMTPKVFAQYIK